MNCNTFYLRTLLLCGLFSFIDAGQCFSNERSESSSSVSVYMPNGSSDKQDDKVKDLDRLIDKYAGLEDVTHVYISKTMLNMAPNIKMDGVDLSSKISKLDNLQILTCNKHRKNSAYTNLQAELEAIVTIENGYEELMRMKSGEEMIIICTKELKARKKREFLLYRKDRVQLTVMVFRGTLTLEELKDVVNMEGVNK